MNNQEERIQTYESFQDRARSAMKRVMGKKEKQEKPRDAGAIAAKIMRNKEHNKYVNFLDADD
jgi:hypothetical protein